MFNFQLEVSGAYRYINVYAVNHDTIYLHQYALVC